MMAIPWRDAPNWTDRNTYPVKIRDLSASGPGQAHLLDMGDGDYTLVVYLPGSVMARYYHEIHTASGWAAACAKANALLEQEYSEYLNERSN